MLISPKISLLQFSDCHIGSSQRTPLDAVEQLNKSIQYALSMRVTWDGVIFTGDLVELGSLEEYLILKKHIQQNFSGLPIYLCIGNHDSRDAFKQVFKGFWNTYISPDNQWLQYSIDLGFGLRLLVVDSNDHGSDAGKLCKQRLDWIRNEIQAYPNDNFMIAIHHLPFVFGNSIFDAMAIEERSNLSEIIRNHPNITRMICGHVHRTMTAQIGQCPIFTAPSTFHSYGVDYQKNHRSGINTECAGFSFHQWHPEPGWISHSVLLRN